VTTEELQDEPATVQEKTAQERILLAAERIFALKGYAGTRVSDIAETAEANVALINYYFSSKEKLYHGVLDRLFSKWGEHVGELVWNDEDPERVLTAYIYKHFEFKCNNLNMLRIFHWESLSDGAIYQDYISRYWEKDAREKLEALKQWKRRGLLNPNLNEHVVLALIWGMMDRLLLSRMNHLEFFLGADDREVEPEELQQAMATAVMEMGIYGALKRPEGSGVAPSLPKPCRLFVAFLDDEAAESPDLAELAEGLASVPGIVPRLLPAAEPLPGDPAAIDGLVLVVGSRYGELEEPARRRLEELAGFAEANGLTGLPAAAWVIRGDREALPLQSLLEQRLGRLGLFPLPRLIEQSPDAFGKRFAQFARRMLPGPDKE